MYVVYLLRSEKDGGYYFGHCEDLPKRLNRHNKGYVKTTKARAPFVVHYSESFNTKSEAYRREMFFKSLEGRKWLKQNGII